MVVCTAGVGYESTKKFIWQLCPILLHTIEDYCVVDHISYKATFSSYMQWSRISDIFLNCELILTVASTPNVKVKVHSATHVFSQKPLRHKKFPVP